MPAALTLLDYLYLAVLRCKTVLAVTKNVKLQKKFYRFWVKIYFSDLPISQYDGSALRFIVLRFRGHTTPFKIVKFLRQNFKNLSSRSSYVEHPSRT